jgi:cardiolipin synthase
MIYVIVMILVLFLATIFLYYSYFSNMSQQYRKKQQADAALYKHVLDHLQQHLSLEAGIQQYGIRHQDLLTFIHRETRFPLTQNDSIRILLDGEETYEALFASLQQAEHHIHLDFYTVQHDEVGKKLLKILMKKVQSGVQVRLLLDAVGSRSFDQDMIDTLRQYGIQCRLFAPPKLKFLTRFNFRNHRKIAVIDGKVGLIGGLNVGKEYVHQDPRHGYWRDIHTLVKGESVLLLQRIFATDWYYVSGEKIEEEGQYFPTTGLTSTDPALIQVVPSGPDMDRQVIKRVYARMILSARERLWIGTPYFVPDRQIMDAFRTALSNGVDVTILVPEKTDHAIVQAASYAYFEELLQAGATIQRFHKGFYHAKTALVDQEVAKIGSANFDQRSFRYSFEAGLFIYHQQTCEELRKTFEADFKEAIPLTLEEIRSRSVWQKAWTRIALLFAPLL